ncbi:MAG TPA: RagB/SusD family nutrient uptake outer membrane protein [Aequorivita sp.]|nr:RagB/SusD family nutrient uptake outer membrane protein [Aequorivita sp.]
MKKLIYKIAVLALVTGGLTSCDSELDQIPFDEFANESAYVSVNDFENAARGIYLTLTNSSLYGGSDGGGMLDAPDVLADNVTFSQTGRGSRRTLHNWQYGASDQPMAGLYLSSYSMIYRANLLLSYSEDFNGANKAKVVAEAKALRALGHLNLVTFFGKMPTQSGDANGSLGVAYVTDPDPLIEPARETVGAVYDKIVKDLVEASADMPATNAEGRFTKQSVNLLLSRVYLYMGGPENWTKAVAAASNVTSSVGKRANIVGVWEDTSKDGVLFNIPFSDNPPLNFAIGVTWSQFGVTTLVPEYVVSYPLYNLFAADDIRKDAYTFQGSNGSGSSKLEFNAIKKLFAKGGNGKPGLVDIKLFRVAEAKLNMAEAQYNLGNEPGALATLNTVRDERYTSYPGGETGIALRDAIRLERRLEFAFESHRFFDLKRWGESIDRGGFGDLADGSGTPSDGQSLTASSTKFQLPIPQTAIDVNPNLVQNPGY